MSIKGLQNPFVFEELLGLDARSHPLVSSPIREKRRLQSTLQQFYSVFRHILSCPYFWNARFLVRLLTLGLGLDIFQK